MNQTCKVCGEPAAGFHFGAFTCEGCKSFFGRSYNNLSSITECKNNGKCIIDKKNRTTCKACRLRKCYTVGMSKGGSRYGRRSNWFKIHCLLQEQQQQAVDAVSRGGAGGSPNGAGNGFGDMAAAAAQHMQQQQRNSLAMGGLLGYPGYLSAEIMQSSTPFPPQRHPAADVAAAAATLPFFNMMNSLPHSMGGSAPSAFQIPSHLLFSGYHPVGIDAAYRAEMYKHRSSVDSAASGESQRYSPTALAAYSAAPADITSQPREMTPELCVSGDDEEQSVAAAIALSHHSMSPVSMTTTSPVPHAIHSPIAIRASPVAPITPAPMTHFSAAQAAPSPISFAVKMQSLSPVSVCSIGAETTQRVVSASSSPSAASDQDCPMDLSMKTSMSSVSSFESESSSEEQSTAEARRKFYRMSREQESDDACSSSTSTSTSTSNSDSQVEEVKRQKLAAADEASATSYGGFAQHNNANNIRLFVCV